ncbi:MAG: ATPase [Firmicutes bacterium]|nr:ATPase [Bacillota bacterium]
MTKEIIDTGKTYLGIEFGSTRIKAVLLDDTYHVVATGNHNWENRYEKGYWTYRLEDIICGLQECYASLAEDVRNKYGIPLKRVGAMGISAMMHGYLVFDQTGQLLTPFRTWRNTTTAAASEKLTELFGFNIPQRWSIAHLYQAILNQEEHVPKIARLCTLSSYIHLLLSGRHETGLGDASGIFPVENEDYNPLMIQKFDELADQYPWNLRDILPAVRNAGEKGAFLTDEGAKLLDPSGNLLPGVPMCPSEGDAGTGMVATNSVLPQTGNLSAGTSVFSMLVLEQPLRGVYPEIDVCTTPDGTPVAMVHSNNGCSELDAWVQMFMEFSALTGNSMEPSDVYSTLYRHAMTQDSGSFGVVAYNFLAAEPVAGVENGVPLYFRKPESKLTLANMMRAQLNASLAPVCLGIGILAEKENVYPTHIVAHGGLFKTKGVAQQILADALNCPVSTMGTAGEGGAWGMALLAAYMEHGNSKPLGDWLNESVFDRADVLRLEPDPAGVLAYDAFMKEYKTGLAVYAGLKEESICLKN